VDDVNLEHGIIVAVGILVAISIGFIAMNPDDIIQPRIVSVEEKSTPCTLDYAPVCGIDGVTYGNLCMLDASDVKLDHDGECIFESEPDKEISVNSHIMPKTAIVGDVLLVEVEFRDDDGNIVDHVNYDITAMQDGTEILSDIASHRHPGKHPVHETNVLSASPVEIKVVIQGLGHGDDITEPKGIVTTMTVVPEPAPELSLPMSSGTHTVNIAEGSGTPGCEETNECFLPNPITISVGDTVLWNNPDSAAHTVTSGNISDGHDGMFDSGLFMSGNTFEFTFDKAGTYDYFCMVHPWMTGKVIVNDVEEMTIIEPEPTPESELEPEPTPESEPVAEPKLAAIVSIPLGAATPGCEDNNECFLPHEISVTSGTTVTWSNDDSAAHTVTSGSVNAGPTGVFDSGLFMSGNTFEFTFDKVGTYDYFCMVHPWMTGIVTVN